MGHSGFWRLLSSRSSSPVILNDTRPLRKLKTSSITSSSFRSLLWSCMVSVSACLSYWNSASNFTARPLMSQQLPSSQLLEYMDTRFHLSFSRLWFVRFQSIGYSGLQYPTLLSRQVASWSECTGRTSRRIWKGKSGGLRYCYSALSSSRCFLSLSSTSSSMWRAHE